jgi:hypothetical protein
VVEVTAGEVVDEGGGSEVLVPVVGRCVARAVLGPFFCGGPVFATAVAVTATSTRLHGELSSKLGG